LLLYGPPGTGKTYYLKQVCSQLGFLMLSDAFAGAELLGGIVGETEAKTKAVFSRSKMIPWLPCCLLIDEIDAIAPNRESSKISEHKIDSLSALLTVFGGAK
jgi:SpoVK/Ycf46/Vps4 family AAA+-type ATPase